MTITATKERGQGRIGRAAAPGAEPAILEARANKEWPRQCFGHFPYFIRAPFSCPSRCTPQGGEVNDLAAPKLNECTHKPTAKC